MAIRDDIKIDRTDKQIRYTGPSGKYTMRELYTHMAQQGVLEDLRVLPGVVEAVWVSCKMAEGLVVLVEHERYRGPVAPQIPSGFPFTIVSDPGLVAKILLKADCG